LGEPSRESWVSRYENNRPCSNGSLEKSMPGTMLRRAERHLLGFSEEVVGIAIQHHAADHL
jgi:hypothetical protein